MTAGIIDLGSNSVRISIVDLDSGKHLYMGKSPIMLSQGMNEDMCLKDEPVKRCIKAFSELNIIMEKHNVSKVYAVATAAVRKAKNKEGFLTQIKNETGISIRVLSGEEEAELDFIGVMDKTKLSDAVILDTGGGSTEFIGARNGRIIGADSIQLGSRSIKELFFSKGETELAKDKAREKVEEIIDSIDWLKDFSGVPVVGIGGSNRTVARISIGNKFPDGPIDEYDVSRKEVFEIITRIEETPPLERQKIKGITPDRTDIILGGVLFLECLMKKLDSPYLSVTDAGLRDGIIKKLMKDGSF